MAFDDAVNHGEPEPGPHAERLGGEERVLAVRERDSGHGAFAHGSRLCSKTRQSDGRGLARYGDMCLEQDHVGDEREYLGSTDGPREEVVDASISRTLA